MFNIEEGNKGGEEAGAGCVEHMSGGRRKHSSGRIAEANNKKSFSPFVSILGVA